MGATMQRGVFSVANYVAVFSVLVCLFVMIALERLQPGSTPSSSTTFVQISII